ncbi:unnamed protein product [Musa acuminata subsp. malaccensis]|uniref:Hexosyltransferase n=1 Tax=Musa acuminata subsp. malaccensis TaxID=214687 RepID=A0A804L1Q5_MUSAM|nr:PREDICTED: probable galacturonosyltransferase-like 6 [Musa acuminata subsp. malaccensis]CAG1854973.1 unnamed protein product [Musa acuminata subsp. malaccensis]
MACGQKKTNSPSPPPPVQERNAISSSLFFFLLLFFFTSPTGAAFFFALAPPTPPAHLRFEEANQFHNSDICPSASAGVGRATACDPSYVHIAMTLDSHYLRGSIAAVYSILWHTSCPDTMFFHFIAPAGGHDGGDDKLPSLLGSIVRSVFPSLRFEVYTFQEELVSGLISSSVRQTLENPLNYARVYLADLLDPCVHRVVYLDSDVVVVDDVRLLWDDAAARLASAAAVVAAPEYCHANFTRYFTSAFWAEGGARVFAGRRRRPCYFNTGVMVMDLRRWRAGGYRRRIERWMEVQRERRIYELGSLPPFLLVLAGEVEGLDHRWNQHGLGGDNLTGECRWLHPGPVSLMHWSGKGKPWDRLDAGSPCPVDHLWHPYDLFIRPSSGTDILAFFILYWSS